MKHLTTYKLFESDELDGLNLNEGRTEKSFKSKDNDVKKQEFRHSINNLIKSKGCETKSVGNDLEIHLNKNHIAQIMFRNDYIGVKKEGTKFAKEFKYDELGKVKSEISDILKSCK